ncbi:MAG TPA: MFS transporter [Candidatus Binataceae bacterium]|nr:MFS transporter [Candidatus Binataceae bacterium]
MAKQTTTAWLIVAGLWIAMGLLFGSVQTTAGMFYRAVAGSFHLSRGMVSLLSSMTAPGLCVGMVLSGWLMQRVDAKRVMLLGAVLVGLGFVCASRAHSFAQLLASCLLSGFGSGLGAYVPVSFIIGNWFGKRSGLAMGVAMTGAAFGGSAMVMLVGWVIAKAGWRWGYVALGLPVFLIAVPLIALIRSRPNDREVAARHEPAAELTGLELGPALRSREFWLVFLALFTFGWETHSIVGHLPPYLSGIGYGTAEVSTALSAALALGSVGKIGLGWLADYIDSRLVTMASFVTGGFGMVLLIGSASRALLIAGVLVMGLSWTAPLALVPVVTMKSLGLKNYGAIFGVAAIATALGSGTGPVVLGWVYDLTGSYRDPLLINAALMAVTGLAICGCRPLAQTLVAVAEAMPLASQG